MQPRWEKLSEEMAQKKENLEELIRNTSVSQGVGRGVTARPVQIVPIKEEDMQPHWEKLSEEMAEK